MIYLDNAATARPNGEAVKAALHFLEKDFYNPSAMYKEGFQIHREVESARKNILAKVADIAAFDFIFTSCGSESDNQGIFSCARRGNCVTTLGEHAAIFNAAADLKRRGVEVRFAKLKNDGSVDEENLLSLVDANTTLVSVIHVNNETGAINDIASIAKKVKTKNPSTVFHSDGVQAFGKIPFRMTAAIDFYSVSAHKIGGIRGIAGLIRSKKKNLFPLIYGGGQEVGLRGGTENVFAIKQFECAAEQKFLNIEKDLKNVSSLNEIVRAGLDKNLFRILSSEQASPYILSISAPGLRGETLMHMINDQGVLVGTGSACSSRNRYSRVILACGVEERYAEGVLRISFSAENTEKEVTDAVKIINECAAKLSESLK